MRWNEKYRPSELEDFVLSPTNRKWIRSWIHSKEFPSSIFIGEGGTGKTSLAYFLTKECDRELFVLDHQLKNESSTHVNHLITSYATTKSMFGGNGKTIVINEADSLTDNVIQHIKQMMEPVSHTTNFILTINDVAKLEKKDKAFVDRFVPMEFDLQGYAQDDDAPGESEYIEIYKPQMFHILKRILIKENIEFDHNVEFGDSIPESDTKTSNVRDMIMRSINRHCFNCRQQVTMLEQEVRMYFMED